MLDILLSERDIIRGRDWVKGEAAKTQAGKSIVENKALWASLASCVQKRNSISDDAISATATMETKEPPMTRPKLINMLIENSETNWTPQEWSLYEYH